MKIEQHCNDYIEMIILLKDYLNDSLTNLKRSQHKDKYSSILCETVFHRSYVVWELFISDYLLFAINEDSSYFIKDRENEILNSIKTKFGEWDNNRIEFKKNKYFNIDNLKLLLDQNGENITFKNFNDLENKFNRLTNPLIHKKLSSINQEEKELINCSRLIRNLLAHQSKKSFKELNNFFEKLRKDNIMNNFTERVSSIKNIGAYLKVKKGSEIRVVSYINNFISIMEKLKKEVIKR